MVTDFSYSVHGEFITLYPNNQQAAKQISLMIDEDALLLKVAA